MIAVDPSGDPIDRSTQWHDVLPGVSVVAVGTMAAAFAAERYGAPVTLMALFIGLALNFLAADPRLQAGLSFASGSVLRLGVVLLGCRIAYSDIVALGATALFSIAVVLFLTLISGLLTSRALGLGAAFGVLAGGAVAICGASAAVVLAAALGDRRVVPGQVTVVLVAISSMSAAAMVLYPGLARAMGLSDVAAGFVLGASIHDVSQAIGAGYAFSGVAGDTAAIVKMARVSLLVPTLLIVAVAFPPERGSVRGIGLPWFVVAFFALGAVNSAGLIPMPAAAVASRAATIFLTTAVTATAIQAPVRQIVGTGAKPLTVIAAATAVALLLSLGAATLLFG